MKLSQVFRSTSLRFALLIAVSVFGGNCFAQQRRASPAVTDLTDLINAMQFSADGRVLVIARGSRDDYRVELWDAGTGKLIRTIRGFDGAVWSASLTPDGRTLVTASGGTHPEKVAKKPGSRNGRRFTELKWWDAQTGDLKYRLESSNEDVATVAALHSPDGRLLATVENRLSIRGSVFGDTSPLPAQVLSPMRTWFSMESDLKLLDAANGEVRMKLKEGFASLQAPLFMGISRTNSPFDVYRRQRVGPVIFSPDGKFVAAWSPTEARLWSSSTGSEVLKLKKFKGRLSVIAFSPDGQLVAGAVTNNLFKNSQIESKSELHIWEVATGAERQLIPLNTHTVTSLSFANNGRQLLIGGLQLRENHSFASMELVDLETGSLGKLLANDEGTNSSICLSPDGETMAFQIDASTVKLVETHGWRTKFTLGSDEEASSGSPALRRFMVTVKSVPAVTFLDDEKTVASEIEDGGIKVWDARTGEARKSFARDAETGVMAAISASGLVAELGPDETVRLWSIDRDGYRTVPASNQRVSAIALSDTGRVLAIAYGNSIAVIGTDDLKTRRTLEGFPNGAALALSHNGRWVAAAGTGGAVRIWDADAGTVKINFSAGADVTALRFDAQDRFLATAHKNGNVAVWSADRGELVFAARKHEAAVNAITFSSDGTLMATGGDDRSAIIWDVQARKTLHTLKGHDLVVSSLAFSPNGETLAVGSGNASVVLWNVKTGKLNRVMK